MGSSAKKLKGKKGRKGSWSSCQTRPAKLSMVVSVIHSPVAQVPLLEAQSFVGWSLGCGQKGGFLILLFDLLNSNCGHCPLFESHICLHMPIRTCCEIHLPHFSAQQVYGGVINARSRELQCKFTTISVIMTNSVEIRIHFSFNNMENTLHLFSCKFAVFFCMVIFVCVQKVFLTFGCNFHICWIILLRVAWAEGQCQRPLGKFSSISKGL